MKKISPSLVFHFVFYILYLFFYKIIGDKETILLFKPVILASISFYYISQNKLKKNLIHFVIIGLLFISDNMNLFGETLFHEISIGLYVLVLFILLYLIIKDSTLLKEGSSFNKYLELIMVVFLVLFVFTKLVSTYVLKTKFIHYYLIVNYLVVFLSVFVLSFYNLFKIKSNSSRFLVATLMCLFVSDLFSVINTYYFSFKPLIYLSVITELPVYYFLIKYFINRDIERIK